MSAVGFPFLGEAAVPVLQAWVLQNVQSGLLVFDSGLQVVFANQWFLQRARLTADDVRGKTLPELFPNNTNHRLERALQQAARTGFASVLSETLHPSPLPLYAPSASAPDAPRLNQTLQIIPMGHAVAREAGQRYVLLQIADVTAAVARDRLLREQADKLHTLAHVDALTRIGNRRHFDAMLAREWGDALRNQQPISLVLFDVDNFKLYNDVYGHPQGDLCLKKIAQVIESVARRSRDVACRYGGEELVMLLPDTDQSGAQQLAQHVLEQVHALNWPHESSPSGIVTISAGVSSAVPQATQNLPDILLRQADLALYQAKNQGRDQVVVYQPD